MSERRRGSTRSTWDAIDVRPVRAWLDRLAASSGLEARAVGRLFSHEVYLDTADQRLRRAGLVLCVVERDGEWRAELGPASAKNGLRRDVQIVPGARPDQVLLGEGPLVERTRAVAGRQELCRLLEIEKTREELILAAGGADLAAITLEETSVPLGEAEGPMRLARVEVDSTAQGRVIADRLLASLTEGCGLRPSLESAFEAVSRAVAPELAPPDLGPTEIRPELTIGEVAYRVLRRQFAHVLANEPGTRLGEDIEALHDMRVAVRRMRAALRLYRQHLPARVLGLVPSLRWLGLVLGDVRDLDVHRADVTAWREQLEAVDRDALDALDMQLETSWRSARRRLLRALDSRRYERLVERVQRVLVAGPGRRPTVGREPILSIVPELIEGRLRRVTKCAARVHKDSPAADYHEVRIRCKALRYALEFHAELLGTRAARMIAELKRVQDVLGDHQDACVAGDWLRELVERRARRLPARTVFVIGRLTERYAQLAAELRRSFPRRYDRIRRKRWRSLRAAMQAAALRGVPVSGVETTLAAERER